MRNSINAVIVSMLLLTSCASPLPTSNPPQSRIVGTWRWVKSDGKPVTGLSYTRYYADGTCAWWPAIEVKFSNNGVTYTHYKVDGNVLDTAPNADPIYGPFHRYKLIKFKGGTMIIIGEENDHDVFERVIPDLEPGK